MKGGIYFFIKCGSFILVLRILLVASFAALFAIPVTSSLFFIMIAVSAVLVAGNIITMKVREPKEKEVLDFISDVEMKYIEKVKFREGLVGNSRVHHLRAYSENDKLSFSRQVGYDVMYSKLCTAVAVEQKDYLIFCAEEISLLRKDDGAETVRWKINKGEKCLLVRSEMYDEDFKISKVTISNKSVGESLTLIAKDDFHLREMLAVICENVVSE